MKFPLNSGVVGRPAAAACHRFYLTIINVLGLLLLAGLLQGCSAVKVFYNQTPDFGYWYLDGHFDFNGAQSLQVKDELYKLQAWHRRTQLPAYIETLQQWQQQLPADIDAAAACAAFADVRQMLVAVSAQAEPAAVALVGTLNAGQLVQLEKRFEKGNADYREDFLEASPKVRRDKRYKEDVKRAEKLYGSLEQAQQDVIRRRIKASHFDAALFYAEKLRRQRDALQTLLPLAGGQASLAARQSAMRGLFERTLTSPNPAYRDYMEVRTRDACETFAELHNSTTTIQRKRAVDTLKGYEIDLKALAAQRP